MGSTSLLLLPSLAPSLLLVPQFFISHILYENNFKSFNKARIKFSEYVLKSVKHSIQMLKSCERLIPLAESLGITQRCIDSIAIQASSTDPSLFGWPGSDGNGDSRVSNQIMWNGIETGSRKKSVGARAAGIGTETWFKDLALLSLSLFKRVILAMKGKDVSLEIIESCFIYYAKKYMPGISRSSRKPSSSSIPTESEHRELLETI